jgi:hypothetical protein
MDRRVLNIEFFKNCWVQIWRSIKDFLLQINSRIFWSRGITQISTLNIFWRLSTLWVFLCVLSFTYGPCSPFHLISLDFPTILLRSLPSHHTSIIQHIITCFHLKILGIHFVGLMPIIPHLLIWIFATRLRVWVISLLDHCVIIWSGLPSINHVGLLLQGLFVLLSYWFFQGVWLRLYWRWLHIPSSDESRSVLFLVDTV